MPESRVRFRPWTDVMTLQSFYLTIRQALLHPGFSKLKGHAFSEADMMKPYSSHPSTKINALLVLLKHHVGKICPEGIEEITSIGDIAKGEYELGLREDWAVDWGDNDQVPTNADKIIVYCGFPSLNWIIMQALEEYDIKFVELNGRSHPAQRAKIIEQFQRNADISVLLLSQVGTCGLNMAFANIVIIVVSS